MKIIDFEKKGNVVRFYLGKDTLKNWNGDDWDDRPYECNAERVYDEYISGYCDVVFPFEYTVLEPKDPEWQLNSKWCKDDMKARKVPCIIAVKEPDDFHEDDFDYYLGNDNALKFYFGDKMEPGRIIVGEKRSDAMKVYLMTINWSGWEDPEANGCDVEVFDSKEKAIRRMNEAVKQEIEEEKEYGREFYESARFEDYVTIVSQYSEYVEFDVIEKEVL